MAKVYSRLVAEPKLEWLTMEVMRSNRGGHEVRLSQGRSDKTDPIVRCWIKRSCANFITELSSESLTHDSALGTSRETSSVPAMAHTEPLEKH